MNTQTLNPAQSMNAWKVWFAASRPKTLWAAVSPVLIGAAWAYGERQFSFGLTLLTLFGAVLIQVATNFVNDYYDYKNGVDDEQRLGPLRVTQAGLVSPEQMKKAIWVVYGLAAIVSAALVIRGGWPMVMVGLLSMICGFLYTGGPYPLGYHGLGDIFAFIFFGPVAVGGTYYVQTLQITPAVICAGIAPGLFSVAIITVNNLRDIEGDKRSGKKTLAVRFGARFAKLEYVLAVFVACLVPLFLFWKTSTPVYSLAAVGVWLFAIPAVKKVCTSTDGTSLNEILALTGRLLLVYSLIFSIALLL